MTALAVIVAGVAAAIWAGGRRSMLRARLGVGGRAVAAGSAGTAGRLRLRSRRSPSPTTASGRILWHVVRRHRWLAVPAGATAVVVEWLVAAPGLAVLTAAGATALLVGRRSAALRDISRQESAVAEACLVLAGELRAGEPPGRALDVVATDWPDLFLAAAGSAAIGGDVAPALRAAADSTRVRALASVAAAWEVSERTGAALSGLLTVLADGLRADAGVRREAESQLSTMRVTARLLAVLPVVTLLLFSGGSGAPVHFLLRSPYGVGCLAVAAVLVLLGLWWVDRLASSVMAGRRQQLRT